MPMRSFTAGGNFTLARSSRTKAPAPARTARASISAVQVSPATTKDARDHSQRLKPCTIAPVTPPCACAFAARAARSNGARPGIISRRSCHCALSHCPARGSVLGIPQSSSAAGHSPKRKMTRAASHAPCVLIWAPIDALDTELIAGTQRGLGDAASCSDCVMLKGSPDVTSASGAYASTFATVTSSATPPITAATRLASAVPTPVPISTASE